MTRCIANAFQTTLEAHVLASAADDNVFLEYGPIVDRILSAVIPHMLCVKVLHTSLSVFGVSVVALAPSTGLLRIIGATVSAKWMESISAIAVSNH